MSRSQLDQILAAVRTRLENRTRAAFERAEALKRAADAYAAAVERESLSELAGRLDVGIDVKSGNSARAAADALRALANALPELRTESVPAPSKKAAAPSRATQAPKLAWSEALAVQRGVLERDADEAPPEGAVNRVAEHKMRVVVVGGPPLRQKQAQVPTKLGFDLEWVPAEKASAKVVRNLEGRILDGRVEAVVILDGFIAHSQSEPLVRAARQTGTPLAYGDKGGVLALEKALKGIEVALAKRGA